MDMLFVKKTANLVPKKESGAMNEAFSDIWGAASNTQHLENLLG
jgi:Zn-dependent metalloprotease